MRDDLRDFLKRAEAMDMLKRVEEADWDLEIGAATDLNLRKDHCPALLFDKIKGYPEGYRVVTCTSSAPRLMASVFNLPETDSNMELLMSLREKLPQWEADLKKFEPEEVETGPILENILSGNDINLLKFPVPKWHSLDGGPYIGTGDAVITKDPDTGEVNLGTYRVQILDEKTTGIHIVPNQHGDIHRRKYHGRGQPFPIAISVGHHPLIFCLSAFNPSPGVEYQFAGAVRGEPVRVIKEEVTGLPIPADSEIVVVGWCHPDKTRIEGPFGEYTGYYVTGEKERPYIEIERIYHRNDPILVGSPPSKPPDDAAYFLAMLRSAKVYNELKKTGLPGIHGVWFEEATNASFFMIVALKQFYAGHAQQVGHQASLLFGRVGRYVVLVDDDIDYTNIKEVLWAVCTRSDPVQDIHITRGAPTIWLDPILPKGSKNIVTSRAIIDACKPYSWIEQFPTTATVEPDMAEQVRSKWKELDL
jgi:UbiD family decarboxylase